MPFYVSTTFFLNLLICWWTRFLYILVIVNNISPLDSKEIKPVNPKQNQPWLFIGRTDAKAKAPVLWPPDGKNWLTGKDPDAGKDWRQGEKGLTENDTVGWHHWFGGHESEQTPGDGEVQKSLECFSPWSGKGSDMTEWLKNNWTWRYSILQTDCLHCLWSHITLLEPNEVSDTNHHVWRVFILSQNYRCFTNFILSHYQFEPPGISLVAQMVKNLSGIEGFVGSIPVLGRSPGEGNGNLL